MACSMDGNHQSCFHDFTPFARGGPFSSGPMLVSSGRSDKACSFSTRQGEKPSMSCSTGDNGQHDFAPYRKQRRNRLRSEAICPARTGCSCSLSDAGGHAWCSLKRFRSRIKVWAICPARRGCRSVWSDAGGRMQTNPNHTERVEGGKAICPAHLGGRCYRDDA